MKLIKFNLTFLNELHLNVETEYLWWQIGTTSTFVKVIIHASLQIKICTKLGIGFPKQNYPLFKT